jgi:hypothetical protein
MRDSQLVRQYISYINKSRSEVRLNANYLSSLMTDLNSNEPEINGPYWLRILEDRVFKRLLIIFQAWQDLSQIKFKNDELNDLVRQRALLWSKVDVALTEATEILMIPKNKNTQNLSELISLVMKVAYDEDADQLVLQKLIKEVNKREFIEMNKILKPSSTSLLYHAVKLENVMSILDRNSILGYTSHRYWSEGKRYKDNQPEYEESFWMKGISMTRDLQYALNWGMVVLVFDRKEIQKQHPIEPYSWGFHLENGSGHYKKEREDFVVLSKRDKKFINQEDPDFMSEYNQPTIDQSSRRRVLF